MIKVGTVRRVNTFNTFILSFLQCSSQKLRQSFIFLFYPEACYGRLPECALRLPLRHEGAVLSSFAMPAERISAAPKPWFRHRTQLIDASIRFPAHKRPRE